MLRVFVFAIRKSILAFIFLFIFSPVVFGQVKNTDKVNQVWLGYYNQTRISNKFGTWTDLHLRTKEDFVSDFSVSILRFGLTYYVSNDVKLTAGYAYVSFYPGDNHKGITQP